MIRSMLHFVPGVLLLAACEPCLIADDPPPPLDWLIRGGTIYDGSGSEPRVADIGIRGDSIAAGPGTRPPPILLPSFPLFHEEKGGVGLAGRTVTLMQTPRPGMG